MIEAECLPEIPYYTMRWSREALDGFIELFNQNNIRSHGKRVRIELKDYGRGDVSFWSTISDE